MEPQAGIGVAAALMEAADLDFLLANPKFAVYLSGKLFQEGGPSSGLLVPPKVDVQVVPGVSPSPRAPSFAPRGWATPLLLILGAYERSREGKD